MNTNNIPAPARMNNEIWGVLGGMGPLSSAEFLSTIYEEHGGGREQESPIVYMISDPTIPDRTECLLNGTEDLLVEHFSSGMNKLVAMGATRVVVCCVTIHPLIQRLAAPLQEKIVSLVDLAFDGVLQDDRKHLLMCSDGTRRMRIFENHPSWKEAGPRIVLPEDADQAAIHSMIYEVKKNQRSLRHLHLLEDLMQKYRVHSFIAGCTEMHMVAKQQARARGRHPRDFCVDPLFRAASIMSQRTGAADASKSRRHIFCH
ncbi:MAG: amino acid racemase [Acidobacteriia bacterium]|nr:amino acid racemase [Terriglobia bacterium]